MNEAGEQLRMEEGRRGRRPKEGPRGASHNCRTSGAVHYYRGGYVTLLAKKQTVIRFWFRVKRTLRIVSILPLSIWDVLIDQTKRY